MCMMFDLVETNIAEQLLNVAVQGRTGRIDFKNIEEYPSSTFPVLGSCQRDGWSDAAAMPRHVNPGRMLNKAPPPPPPGGATTER